MCVGDLPMTGRALILIDTLCTLGSLRSQIRDGVTPAEEGVLSERVSRCVDRHSPCVIDTCAEA